MPVGVVGFIYLNVGQWNFQFVVFGAAENRDGYRYQSDKEGNAEANEYWAFVFCVRGQLSNFQAFERLRRTSDG